MAQTVTMPEQRARPEGGKGEPIIILDDVHLSGLPSGEARHARGIVAERARRTLLVVSS